MKLVRDSNLIRFLKERMFEQWRIFAIAGLFALLTAMAAGSYAFLVKTGMDWLGAADTTSNRVQLPLGLGTVLSSHVMWLLPCLVISASVVRSLSLYFQTILNNKAVQNGLVAIQDALFGKLIDGDYARLTSAASGEFVSQFVNDMNLVREASLRIASNLVKGVLTIIACLIAMFVMDWALATLVLLVYPIAFAPVVRIGERLRKTSRRAQEQAGEMTALLTEGLSSGRDTKAFNLEDYQRSRAHDGFVERAQLYLKVLRGKALVDPLLEIVGGCALAGVLAFTGWRVMNGDASVGDLGGFITAIAAASPEVRALGTLNGLANEAGAALDRIYKVIDAPSEVIDAPDAAVMTKAWGAIRFEKVSFGYNDQTSVLRDIDFEVAPGETIALVGPSGSGKSTIFNLLLRLFEPTHGRILIDDVDIRSVNQSSLRSNIAVVSQDVFLFDDTIEANVALGRLGASKDEIEKALEASACDFVYELPDGLNSFVGEGGRNLSGGQRQRIAIARAMLKDAPILLLDEATSALDASSEVKVQAALDRLRDGRTTLIVAHRLATVRGADRICVVQNGKISEQGKHEQLLKAQGHYADLVKSQLS